MSGTTDIERPRFARMYMRCAAGADGPVLVHCAAGKDRTGIAVALILRLLGVDRDLVLADYILSEQASEAIDRRLNRDEGVSGIPPAFYLVEPEALAVSPSRITA